jgi:hypothetical protein
VAWHDVDGRVLTDKVRNLSAFVDERKRERKAWVAAGLVDGRPPWEVSEDMMVEAVRRRFQSKVRAGNWRCVGVRARVRVRVRVRVCVRTHVRACVRAGSSNS